MTRARKRLIIAAMSLLIMAGGGFYYWYFLSTDAAVRYAEAFLFRRMTVAQVDPDGRYRHFFVSNRERADDSEPLPAGWSSERSDSLTFGFFDTHIEPSVGLGMIVNATAWFRDEEIQLDQVAELERDAFVRELRATVDASPGRSLLVQINGFREQFPSALRKTAFVASVLDINTPVLVFDWPGDQGSSLRGYRRARDVATASGPDLAEMLRLIIDEVRPDRLSLLANSMGGQVLVNAFSELYADRDLADAETEISDVILTAPDVDHAEFDARFRVEIAALTDELIVYVSSNDRALLVSRLINRGLRVGESTLDPRQWEEATALAGLVEPGDDLITLVDVTPVNRTRNFHNFSLETPEFFDDLFQRLIADAESTPANRRIYAVKSPQGSVYWVLTQGR